MKTLTIYNNPIAWFFYAVRLDLYRKPYVNNIHEASITQTSKNYIIEYLLPNFNKKELTVKIEDNRLIIEATRNKTLGWFNNTRNCETDFIRGLNLSEDMSLENIKAKFKNNVLKITIPKTQEYTSYREIPISGTEKTNQITSVWSNLKQSINKYLRKYNLISDRKL